jgi:hypothetical protein
MTTRGLDLDTANRNQGFDVIPAGTLVELVMKIKPGNVGIENLLKRTSKGDAEFLDVEFVVRGGEFDKRKLFQIMLLNGTTAGHAKAGEISRSKLRAIFEGAHGIDPNDNTPATTARRANVLLVEFDKITFLATLEIEPGGKRPDGSGFYKDKNVIGKVLRPGDQGYRRLEQPPPAPIERSAPPAAAASGVHGAPTVAPTVMAKPDWAS